MHSSLENASRRVLVIDDNPAIHEDFRKILGSRLESAHAVARTEAALFGDGPPEDAHPRFHVDSAFQGEEGVALVARARAENRPYALAFIDVRMPPGMDGIETVIRIWDHAPEMQIVICTAYSDCPWQEICDKLGRSDQLVILKKPFDNIEVLQLASALSEKWRLAREAKCRVQDLERSISHRVRELQQANERAEAAELQASRTRSELFGKLSREILALIEGVIRTAESLLETLLDARQRACVEVIRASAKTLLTIVSDVSSSGAG